MTYYPRSLISFSFILFIFTLLTACSEDKPPLRIATNPWPGYEYLHLAEKLGYFNEENVNVKLIEFSSLADSSRSFERGQVDAWGATIVELILSREQSNRTAQAFLVTNVSNGGDKIVTKKSITKLSQLKGKRIGIEPATVDILMLHYALQSVGLSLKDVELIPTSQNRMKQEILNGEITAACVYPPVSVDLLTKSSIYSIYDSSLTEGNIVDVIAADKDILEKRKSDFAAVVRAFMRAKEYAEKNKKDAFATMAKRERISPAEFSEVIKGIQYIEIQDQNSYLQKQGKLSNAIINTIKALNTSGLKIRIPATENLFTDSIINLVQDKTVLENN